MNINKYVDSFCFFSFYVIPTEDKLFYIWEKEDRSHKLYFLDLANESDLKNGTQISDEDFSKGHFSISMYDGFRNFLYVVLDQNNSENTNIWKLNFSNGELNQIKKFNNVNGITYNNTLNTCWCYSKNIIGNGPNNEVFEINLSTGESTFLFNDIRNLDYQIGFTTISKVQGEDAFVFGVEKRNHLQNTNICKYSLESKEWLLLLTKKIEEQGSPILFNKIQNNGFFVRSSHEGFNNFYFYNFANKDLKRITDLSMKYEGATISHGENNTEKYLNIVLNQNNQYFLNIYDLNSKKISLTLSSRINLFETEKDYWGIQSSSDAVDKLVRLNAFGKVIKTIALTSCSSIELEHSISTWINYPSFDGKIVRAILKMPKGELKGAIIQSFYGGWDIYDSQTQRFAELGFAFLSPAVRGSFGWGSEWEKMVDGNWGGDEILDVIWGAKFLEKELNLPPSKIGVVGFSHGGYAALRAITMPNNFKNILGTYFNFGFAISIAGFADLIPFYNDPNTREWTEFKFGKFDKEKYLERSPVNWIEKINTPILLINGKDDSRVPFSSIEKFIEILKKSNLDHDVLVFEHRPHFYTDRETSIKEIEHEVRFLKRFI